MPGSSGNDTGALLAAARPAPRRTLTEAVSDQLIELIASSSTPSPELPTERALSEQLDVSRNVLREALAGLERLSVVEKHGKKRVGDTAQARAQLLARLPTGATELERLLAPLEARRLLEPEIAARAAATATPEAVAEVERWLSLMQEGLRRGERVVAYDSAFHVAIARATRNPTLVTLVGALTDASREAREASYVPVEAAGTYVDDHHAILDAVRAKDADAARAAMAAHLDGVAELARAAFAAHDE